MRLSLIISSLLAAATPVAAQHADTLVTEFRPVVGAVVPVSTQRRLFKDSFLIGVQGAIELRPTLHLGASFSAMVAATSRYPADNSKLHMFQYDVGIERGIERALNEGWHLKPYLGVGGGARRYKFADRTLKDGTCAVAYAAAGTEFQLGRAGIRAEGRVNTFCFKSPIPSGRATTRNDLTFAIAYAQHLH
jgi:hypothetical protein